MEGIEPGLSGNLRWRTPNSCPSVDDAWEKLLVDGYTIVADSNPALGFDPAFREHVIANYFDAGVLKPEQHDVFPPGRGRARSTVALEFNVEGAPVLEDAYPMPVVNQDRGVDVGERHYEHTKVVDDRRFYSWLVALSGLIPPPAEYIPGVVLNCSGEFDPNIFFDCYGRLNADTYEGVNTPFYATLTGQVDQAVDRHSLRKLSGYGNFAVGVNLFEVNRDVVSGPHQDNAHWVAITVIDKHGEGATSQLFLPDSSEPFFEYTLAPGQTLILNDRRFKHSATPLQPANDGTSWRRTIVCTFDFVGATQSI